MKIPKKVNMLDSKIMRGKKLPFMILVNSESILVPRDNGKQSLDESYMNKYQKHVTYSYGFKLLCVDDKFSKLFKLCLGEDAALMIQFY